MGYSKKYTKCKVNANGLYMRREKTKAGFNKVEKREIEE